MNKAPNIRPFQDIEEGMLAGLWYVPEAGFAWDKELKLAGVDALARNRLQVQEREETGPWLRPSDLSPRAMFRRYPVLKSPRLLQDFLRLAADPTLDRILAFASKWGWLGLTRAVVGASGHGEVFLAEPYSAWWEESLKFRALYETWEAVGILINEGSHGPSAVKEAQRVLRERIHWLPDGSGVKYMVELRSGSAERPSPLLFEPVVFEGRDSAGLHHRVTAGPGLGAYPLVDARSKTTYLEHALIASDHLQVDAFHRFRRGDTLEPARYYMHGAINERLRGHVHLTLLPFLGSKIRFFPDTLLASLYLLFGLQVAGAQARERNCENPHCPNGGRFFPGRRDQRFCDKNCRELAGYYRRKERKE